MRFIHAGLGRTQHPRRPGRWAASISIAWLVVSGLSSGGATRAFAQDVRADTIEVSLHEGTNMAVALSPDGATLAMDLQGTLWSVPIAGGAATPLTDEFGDVRQPDWSPDGESIVFQSYRTGTWDIWEVQRDGTGLRQLTFGPYDDREPAWSPDGRRIAFSSDRGGSYDVWELDIASGEVARLTSDPVNAYAPSWAPDSRRIAYVSERQDGAGIRVREADGSDHLLVAMTGDLAGPSWSRDGSRVVFQQTAGGESGLYLVDVAHAPSSPARRITSEGEDVFPFRASWISNSEMAYTSDGRIKRLSTDGRSRGEIDFAADVTLVRHRYERRGRDFDGGAPQRVLGIVSPAVSPAGDQVAFAALGDLWLLDIGNGTPRRVTHDPYVDADPTWSPDGLDLAYTSDRSGHPAVWIRHLATGAERQLTHGEGAASRPRWSPDGSRIAFLDQDGRVLVADVATGASHLVHEGLFEPGRPSWSADGRFIAVTALRRHSTRYREGVNEVLLLPVDGGTPRAVSPTPDVSLGPRGNSAVLSPDGRKMAFLMNGMLWVQTVRPDGAIDGPPRRLTNELVEAPSWAGDSRTLVFLATDRLKRVNLYDGRIQTIPLELTWRRAIPEGRTVVHAGRLFDGRAPEVREHVDIVIERHRIIALEPHRDALHTGRVIDATNQTVIPGLIDLHAHLGSNEANGRQWLAYGVTSVRDPSAEAYAARERLESVASGARVGPRPFSAGATFDGTRVYYGGLLPLEVGPQLEMELERARVLEYDLIKTYVRLPDRQMARVVELAHQYGMHVTSHEIYPAAAFGADGVEHLSATSRRGYSPKASLLGHSYQDVRDLLIHSRMTYTPTLVIHGGFDLLVSEDPSSLDEPRLTELSPPDVVESARARAARAPGRLPVLKQRMAAMASTIRAVSEGGGHITAGTDSPINPFGLSLHYELELLVRAGLTPVEALQAATLNSATALGVDDDLGTLEVGKLADMLIVDGNPHIDIGDARRIGTVISNGTVLPTADLLQRP